ncbi:hypothetical protein Cadr_000017573 [Camelus dromedarius]|uniref:Uncharacterized protein n=1 Tax=Camelus dromedarius TaxID=9838 RepID=A0A5N4DFF6_CAMDR|nr:hypothetical protein Cadr_000017573 [Camelus dromedarius]
MGETGTFDRGQGLRQDPGEDLAPEGSGGPLRGLRRGVKMVFVVLNKWFGGSKTTGVGKVTWTRVVVVRTVAPRRRCTVVQWARGREAEAEMEPDHGALGSWAQGPKGTGRPLKERKRPKLEAGWLPAVQTSCEDCEAVIEDSSSSHKEPAGLFPRRMRSSWWLCFQAEPSLSAGLGTKQKTVGVQDSGEPGGHEPGVSV